MPDSPVHSPQGRTSPSPSARRAERVHSAYPQNGRTQEGNRYPSLPESSQQNADPSRSTVDTNSFEGHRSFEINTDIDASHPKYHHYSELYHYSLKKPQSDAGSSAEDSDFEDILAGRKKPLPTHGYKNYQYGNYGLSTGEEIFQDPSFTVDDDESKLPDRPTYRRRRSNFNGAPEPDLFVHLSPRARASLHRLEERWRELEPQGDEMSWQAQDHDMFNENGSGQPTAMPIGRGLLSKLPSLGFLDNRTGFFPLTNPNGRESTDDGVDSNNKKKKNWFKGVFGNKRSDSF